MLKTTSIVRCLRLLSKCHADYCVQHWHGFFQKGTNWADGPAFINQCPIASGHSFLYDFQVPDQAGKLSPLRRSLCPAAHISCTGTFWYHSHLSTQYCDGLRGPFVVYDPKDPLKRLYDVDDGQLWLTLLPPLGARLMFIHRLDCDHPLRLVSRCCEAWSALPVSHPVLVVLPRKNANRNSTWNTGSGRTRLSSMALVVALLTSRPTSLLSTSHRANGTLSLDPSAKRMLILFE